MAKLTRLLRLIGPIPKKWLIKVCEEITKLATGCRMCEKHACKHRTKYTHTHTNTYFLSLKVFFPPHGTACMNEIFVKKGQDFLTLL